MVRLPLIDEIHNLHLRGVDTSKVFKFVLSLNCLLLISSRIPDLIRNSKLVRFYFIPYILRDCLLKHHFPFGSLPRSVSRMFLYCFVNINKCLSKFNLVWWVAFGLMAWLQIGTTTRHSIGIRILMNWKDGGHLEANQQQLLPKY